MAQYTREDVQSAVDGGLIGEDDAQALLEALEPEMSGGAMAATGLGALAGAGLGALAGSKGLKTLGSKLGGENKLGKFLGKQSTSVWNNADTTQGQQLGLMGGGLLGSGLGALGGDLGGEAAFPGNPGSGLQAQSPDANGNLDYDSLLAILVDPSAPGDLKRQAMQMMQQLNQGMSQEQPQLGAEDTGGFPYGAAGGAAVGIGSVGAPSAYYGNKLGASMAGAEGAGRFSQFAGKPMVKSANPMGMALGGLGALAGGAGMGLAGSEMFDQGSRYRDPLS